MATYSELTSAGIPTRAAAALTGVSRATAARQTCASNTAGQAQSRSRAAAPANKLSQAERDHILAVLNSDEFIDQPPLQVFASLLDRGQYLCSISTMYRILAANRQVRERRRLARHQPRAIPELEATGPGQVYSWDITKLPGPSRGVYYDAYVMIDVYSRYIVGAHVHHRETGPLAEEMIRDVFGVHGIPQVVHADRGTAMTSKPVAMLLADLGVTRSHSRPRVSNDNPYSESLFKTLKYLPEFPDRFASLGSARAFIDEFAQHYNHRHHHSSIGLHTPADVHYGHATALAQKRSTALAAARAAHPERFGTSADPKILDLPQAAWINKPQETANDNQIQEAA